MDRLKLFLEANGFPSVFQGKKLMLETCPKCRLEKPATINETHFLCLSCSPTAIPISQFLNESKLEFDNTSDDFALQVDSEIADLFNPAISKGFTTGYTSLDKRTGGLLPGHLYILAAETGMGKSVFATNLIVNSISHEDTTCSYLDLENGKMVNYKRFIAVHGNMSVRDFDDVNNLPMAKNIAGTLEGRLFHRDHKKLAQYLGTKSGIEMARSLGSIIKYDSSRGARVFVIDPLENFEMGTDDYNAIAKVVEYFKNLAQELIVAIIILHHIKKPERAVSHMIEDISEAPTAKYRVPTIHDLIGSSKITNKATDVWVLVRQKDDKDVSKQGRILIRILKSREDRPGESGDVYFKMNLDTLRINESIPIVSNLRANRKNDLKLQETIKNSNEDFEIPNDIV